MGLEATITNTTKEIAINVTNHIINHLPNDTINVGVQIPDNQLHLLWEAVTAIGTLAGVGLTAYGTFRYSKKQNQRNALVDIFKMLNNTEHKNAESLIIQLYRDGDLYTLTLNDDYRKDAEIVWRNYDQLGLLTLKSGVIPNIDDVLDMFGTLVVVLHKILFQEIKRKRDMQERYFMTNFTKLAINSYRYWKIKQHIPRDAKTNEPITELEVNLWKESLPNE